MNRACKSIFPFASALALAAACASLWACGGSGGSSGPKVPTKAQALSYGRAVNLTIADLAAAGVPGFKASPPATHEGGERDVSAQVATCAGGVAPSRAIAEVSSAQFEHEVGVAHQLASSEVTVMPSAALAKQDLNAISSAKGAQCIEHFLSQLLSKRVSTNVSIEEPKVAPLAVSAPGSDGSFGLHMTMTVTAGGAQFPLTLDVLGFIQGSAEITMTAGGLPQAFPSSNEKRLFATLVGRATSNSL